MLVSALAEPLRTAMRCSGIFPPVPAFAVGDVGAAGPLIVTVELDVTVGVVSDVTATVTVLFPEPVTVAFSGICAVPSGVTENCEAGLDSEAVTGPVVPVICADIRIQDIPRIGGVEKQIRCSRVAC